MRRTVLEIIQKTTAELGLTQPTQVVGSTDADSIQLVGLLTALCEELVHEHPWEALQTEWDITTIPGTETYTVPADFDRVINNTEWNRSTRMPMTGPKTPAEWQFIKSWVINNIPVAFRFKNDKLVLNPVPSAELTLVLEYISSYYVYDVGASSYKLNITADSDKLAFDDRLLINGLKLKWKEAKGLSTSSALFDYENTLEAVKGADGGGAVLSLGRNRFGLGYINVPDGNWNQ